MGITISAKPDAAPLRLITTEHELRNAVSTRPEGDIEGYEFRFRLALSADAPAEASEPWTPWYFIAAPHLELMLQQWIQYMQQDGHLALRALPPGAPH